MQSIQPVTFTNINHLKNYYEKNYFITAIDTNGNVFTKH